MSLVIIPMIICRANETAHVIRNRSSQLFHSVCTLQARHRWCLTGTPIQNRVEDFGALVGFLRVYPFDSPAGFYSNFINFIQKGDNRGIEKLKALVQAISLRRTKEYVFGELKLRHELNICNQSSLMKWKELFTPP